MFRRKRGGDSIIGCALGTAVTWIVLAQALGSSPDLRFALAIITLGVLAAVGASIPPAVIAARRDPVKALRIP